MKTEVLIVGAGVIGSALALELSRLSSGMKICVTDFDLEGSFSSSERNAGGVRATFNQPINIEASKISLDYFRTIADEIGFKECGYLWLCTEEQRKDREKRIPLWESYQWPVEVLNHHDIQNKAPILNQLSDVSCGLFGSRDGLLNPNLLKNYYRNEARKNGVEFLDRHFFLEAKETQTAEGWEATFKVYEKNLEEESLESILQNELSREEQNAFHKTIQTKIIVNCGGAWAGEIAKRSGLKTASSAVRRQISLFDCHGDFSETGMIIDTSGVYFHPESTFFLSGIAEHEEPIGKNFKYGGDDFFQEKIWLPLSQRSTHFENLKHISGWAGLYEVSPDESAIIGKCANQYYESHSYSGHGVMHSYAAAKALAEKIILGRYESFDFSALSGDRFNTGKLISETAVI